jgi:chromosome segregation ATPase
MNTDIIPEQLEKAYSSIESVENLVQQSKHAGLNGGNATPDDLQIQTRGLAEAIIIQAKAQRTLLGIQTAILGFSRQHNEQIDSILESEKQQGEQLNTIRDEQTNNSAVIAKLGKHNKRRIAEITEISKTLQQNTEQITALQETASELPAQFLAVNESITKQIARIDFLAKTRKKHISQLTEIYDIIKQLQIETDASKQVDTSLYDKIRELEEKLLKSAKRSRLVLIVAVVAIVIAVIAFCL